MTNTLNKNLEKLQEDIVKSRDKAIIKANPKLIAVSKGHTVNKIEQAYHAGQRHFAENRVQETMVKWQDFKNSHTDITLHLIGSLQSNKVEQAVALFDVIQTIDRIKIVDCLSKEMKKQNRQLPCLIQVNIGEESQKSGILPKELNDFIDYCKKQQLPVAGLMSIPPAKENPAPYFALLKQLADEHTLPERSMGMSGDYQTALRFGATMIRVGTAIFGERNE